MASGEFPYKDGPLNFGHRGAPTSAPENTLASFEKARGMGADGVELDVTLSADGQVVVIHDEDVERTTNGRGRVQELTLAQVKALDAGSWFAPQYAGLRIPTLREVMAWAGDDMLLNIELKSITLRSDGLEEAVVALIREQRLEAHVVVSSFNPLAIRRVRQLAPELHSGLLYASGLPVYLRRAWLRPLADPQALHPQLEMVDEAYMRWAKGKGYCVNVWAPATASEMQRLIALGVDMIITDRPGLLADVLIEQQSVDRLEGGAAMGEKHHPLVALARETIEQYVRAHRTISPPQDLTPEMGQRAGAFVSLHKGGALRGCIGTIEPRGSTVAREVIENAISAATRDPRFPPVQANELDDLEISVDVLHPPEPIESMDELDPQRYGVIVESGWRRGLLLPNLEGVDTVEYQVSIARRKAGIGPDELVQLYRFEVKRYH
jgi:AmmeMemoRadiSam system protein A